MYRESFSKALRKGILLVGIIFNVGIIFYYKYFNFFMENVSLLFKDDFVAKNILMQNYSLLVMGQT